MRILFAALLLLFAAGAHAQALNNRDLLIPLWEVYSWEYDDFFYTVDESQADLARTQFGYGNKRVVGYLERRKQSGTLPFRRFYKDYPEYNHFYTTSPSEVGDVERFGYTDEGIEGYIYEVPMPGTTALHRLNRWDPATGNQVHHYTTQTSVVQMLQDAGWAYDTVAGYVFASAKPYWTTAAGANFTLGMRCPGPGDDTDPYAAGPSCFADGSSAALFRDFYFPSRNIASTRPAGASTQVITFNFYSRDFFGAAAANGGGEHLSFGFRGQLNPHLPDVSRFCPVNGVPGTVGQCTWQRGLGINLWQSNGSYRGSMLSSEAWWVPSTNTDAAVAGSIALRPSAGAATFQNFVTYGVTARVTEMAGGPHGVGAYMEVVIRDPYGRIVDTATWDTRVQTGTRVKGFDAQGRPVFEDVLPYTPTSPFPTALHGMFAASATGARRDHTVYITNLKITWQ